MNADNSNVVIHRFLLIGLIAALAASALQVGIWLVTGCKEFIMLLLPPLINAGFCFLIFRLLESALDKAPRPEDAASAILIGVAAPLVYGLIVGAASTVVLFFWRRMTSMEDLAAISRIQTYQRYAGILARLTAPCYAAASGMLWWRAKHAENVQI